MSYERPAFSGGGRFSGSFKASLHEERYLEEAGLPVPWKIFSLKHRGDSVFSACPPQVARKFAWVVQFALAQNLCPSPAFLLYNEKPNQL